MLDEHDKSRREVILKELNAKISFHRMWQEITMWLYIFSTIMTVVCTFLATMLSLLEFKVLTSALAGLATVLISVEKSLMFREKWKLHLGVATRLENMKLSFESGLIDVESASKGTQTILDEYARELPIENRQ